MKIWISILVLASALFGDVCACCPESVPDACITSQSMETPCSESDLSDAMEALEKGEIDIAVAIFKSLAEKGDYIAAQNLGVMYHNGYGVPKNLELATYWFDKAEANWEQIKSAQRSSINSGDISGKLEHTVYTR